MANVSVISQVAGARGLADGYELEGRRLQEACRTA
jgi:hypothetical protein